MWRKRRDRRGRLLEGVHWRPECRWWPTDNFEEYAEKPWGDMCNHCRQIARREALNQPV